VERDEIQHVNTQHHTGILVSSGETIHSLGDHSCFSHVNQKYATFGRHFQLAELED